MKDVGVNRKGNDKILEDHAKSIQKIYQEFLAKQEPLGKEFVETLHDKIEELYED